MFSLICALNKRLSKQSWGWWFESPSCSLWRHCNAPYTTSCLETLIVRETMMKISIVTGRHQIGRILHIKANILHNTPYLQRMATFLFAVFYAFEYSAFEYAHTSKCKYIFPKWTTWAEMQTIRFKLKCNIEPGSFALSKRPIVSILHLVS